MERIALVGDHAVGLRDDLPVLSVLSGGFGIRPLAEILTELNKLRSQ